MRGDYLENVYTGKHSCLTEDQLVSVSRLIAIAYTEKNHQSHPAALPHNPNNIACAMEISLYNSKPVIQFYKGFWSFSSIDITKIISHLKLNLRIYTAPSVKASSETTHISSNKTHVWQDEDGIVYVKLTADKPSSEPNDGITLTMDRGRAFELISDILSTIHDQHSVLDTASNFRIAASHLRHGEYVDIFDPSIENHVKIHASSIPGLLSDLLKRYREFTGDSHE